jgi:hypothetical protein
MKIETSLAKVYHGNGRRWFTLKAAKRAEAWRILKENCCDCDHIDTETGYPGNTCELHKLWDDYRERAITWVLNPHTLHHEANDPDLYSETINEVVWGLWKEQQEKIRKDQQEVYGG